MTYMKSSEHKPHKHVIYLFIFFFGGGGGGGWGLGEEECASFRKVPKSLKSHKIYVYPTYN